MKNWEKCINDKGEEFMICTKSELERDVYFLYKKDKDKKKWILNSQSDSPVEFDDIIFGENNYVEK